MNNMTAQPQPDSPTVAQASSLHSDSAADLLSIDLSAAINAAFSEARATAVDATTRAKHAIAKAIECGGLLSRQKQSLPHGTWQTWLTTHCPELSESTARRYMRLANRSHMLGLEDATNLRQAYLATGVLPATPRVRTPSATTPTVSFIRGLDHFRRWFNRRTEELPLEKWSPEARRLLRNELTWISRVYESLRR